MTRNFPWRGPWTHGSAPRKGPLVHPQGSKEGNRNATKALPRSMFENVQSMLSCCRYSLALLMASKFLEFCVPNMEASPSTLHNELKYVGHCWPIRIVGLLHTPLPRNLITVATLSLYIYIWIYMGILGFPQNRDKTRFHGQFVVPACSHKLLAITGSTSANSTSTETNNRIWGSQRIWEATCDHVRPCV